MLYLAWGVASADLAKVQTQSKEKIAEIEAIHTRLEVQLKKAEGTNDLRQVNCILTKLNLVKGLLKASQRSTLVLTRAYIDQDQKMTAIYQKRVDDYRANAVELESSMDECLDPNAVDRRSMLVLIRPEGAGEPAYQDMSPWAWDYVEGSDNLPTIPPASPYR